MYIKHFKSFTITFNQIHIKTNLHPGAYFDEAHYIMESKLDMKEFMFSYLRCHYLHQDQKSNSDL